MKWQLLFYLLCYFNSLYSVLIKLYLTIILLIIMYSLSVWDLCSIPNINKLEKVQYFALKLCSKNWTSNYLLLLQLSIFLLYPPVEQHPSLSFYTSSSLLSSTFLLALFHFKTSPLIIYILPIL